MALILPSGPSWAYCTENLQATPSATAIGTAVTAGASNTEGSDTALLTALAHDVEYLRIGISKFYAADLDGSALLDILIDPAGGSSYSVLIPDLLAGWTAPTSSSAPTSIPLWYDFPVWIPAGATVACRAQSALAAPAAAYVLVQAFGGNANPASWWCGQRVTALGPNAATSRGVDHLAGSGDWSSWANIGAALDVDCGAVQFGVQGTGSVMGASVALHWQFGVGGQSLGPTIVKFTATGETTLTAPTGPIFANLPAGTQFQTRGRRAAGTTTLDCAVYAVS